MSQLLCPGTVFNIQMSVCHAHPLILNIFYYKNLAACTSKYGILYFQSYNWRTPLMLVENILKRLRWEGEWNHCWLLSLCISTLHTWKLENFHTWILRFSCSALIISIKNSQITSGNGNFRIFIKWKLNTLKKNYNSKKNLYFYKGYVNFYSVFLTFVKLIYLEFVSENESK